MRRESQILPGDIRNIQVVEYPKSGGFIERDFIVFSEGSTQFVVFPNADYGIETCDDVLFTLIRVKGQLTSIESAGLLRKILVAHISYGVRRYVMDFSEVHSFDSGGISAMFVLVTALKRHVDSKVIVFGLRPKVKEMFEHTRITGFFTLVDYFSQAAQLCLAA